MPTWGDFCVMKKSCHVETTLINILSKVVPIWEDFSIKLLMKKSSHIGETSVLY